MKVLKKIKESLKDLHQIILRIFPGKFQNDEKNNISCKIYFMLTEI